jgi:hypothetical protein
MAWHPRRRQSSWSPPWNLTSYIFDIVLIYEILKF